MYVQIEGADPNGDIWQALDAPEPVADTGFTGTPQEIASDAAADYADRAMYDGAEPGVQIRTTVTDEDGRVLAVSSVYTVPAYI